MGFLPFCLLLIIASTHASSLQICPASLPSTGGPEAIITDADGVQQRIQIAETPAPACRSQPLPVPANAVLAVYPLASSAAKQIGNRFIVQGVERNGTFNINSVTYGEERAQPGWRPMPLQENLLAGMSARVFGVEERVQATLANGCLQLRCEAGVKSAGVILSAPWYITQAQARLSIAATGNGKFEVALADAAGAAKETAHTAGHIDGAAAAPIDLALPGTGFDRSGWRQFSIVCPHYKAELIVNDFRLTPDGQRRGARAGWIWNAQAWREQADNVLRHAQRHEMHTLFITVPVQDGEITNPKQLATFVRRAGALGIEIWSVDGDPRMVLPSEHESAIARVHAYAAYNKTVDRAARLRGMQFDIEHYLLPGYVAASAELDRRYLELIRALHRAAGDLPLEFVVPFWWNSKSELLNGLASSAFGLSVMDYRTDPTQIRDFSIPFLEWGVKHGKKVRITLEAGPVEEEQQQRFVKADAGQAWLVTIARMPVLVLLKTAQPNPHGLAFRLESNAVLDGSATTFHKNSARMVELLPAMEAYFSAWPSFNGMGLHGIP